MQAKYFEPQYFICISTCTNYVPFAQSIRSVMQYLKKTSIIFLVCVCLLFGTTFFSCSDDFSFGSGSGKYESISETVFGSGIVFEARALGKDSKKALQEMLQVARTINQSISISANQDINNPDNSVNTNEQNTTPLKKFNDSRVTIQNAQNKNDAYHKIDSYTYDMLQIAKEYYHKTDGYFNIAVLPLLKLWHTDSDGLKEYGWDIFDSNQNKQPNHLPTQQEIADTLQKTKFFDEDNKQYPYAIITKEDNNNYYIAKTTIPDLEIDLGGIAKGYLADKSKEIADKYNLKSALINISGDMYFYKKNYNQQGEQVNWTVGITNPRPQMSYNPLGRGVIAATDIEDTGLVTSGDYERFYQFSYQNANNTKTNDQYQQLLDPSSTVNITHIMDAITGIPIGIALDSKGNNQWTNIDNAVTSATVICTSSTIAESISTAIMAMGLSKGIALLNKLQLEGIIFTADQQYAVTKNFRFYNPDTYNEYKKYTEYQYNDKVNE